MLRVRAPLWQDLAEQQHGIVNRSQLLGVGLSPGQARADIDSGRWRPLFPGVYATFTGPISATARTWAAVLYVGPGAAASHRTALWLGGLLDEAIDPVHVSIPASRRVLPQPGIAFTSADLWTTHVKRSCTRVQIRHASASRVHRLTNVNTKPPGSARISC